MNRERAKELLPIIRAFAEGKEIQCKNSGSPAGWTEFTNYTFDDECDYRIKPAPEVIYVNKIMGGKHSAGFYSSKEYASLSAKEIAHLTEFEYVGKKFIEVID